MAQLMKVYPYGVQRLPSASEMQRAMSCPSSFHGDPIYPETSVAAARGTTVHDFIQRVLSGEDPDEVLTEIRAELGAEDPGLQLCEQLDTSLLPRGGSLEVAVAWNPETEAARVLGTNIGRDYEGHGADRALELVGSADFVGIVGDCLIILDWKSGKVTKAADSWQLKLLAIAFAAVYGATSVRMGLGFLRAGRILWDIIEIDDLALARDRAKIRVMLKALAHARALELAALQEGDHCTYCPCWKRCPAKTLLVRNMVADIGATEAFTLEGLAKETQDEHAARAYKLLERYDNAAKRVREEIEAYAKQNPVPLGDGRWLRLALGDGRDTIMDAQQTIAALADETDEATAALAVRTTKGAVEDATAMWAKEHSVPVGKAKKAVVEALRARGLIQKIPGEEKVRVVKSAPDGSVALPLASEMASG